MNRPSPRPAVPSFIRTQHAFTAHLRDPGAHVPPPDVEPRRTAVYRELMYTNVESLLAGNFPVLRCIMDDEGWHALMQDYFARHRARTPLFPRMPEEFLDYLRNEREERAEDFPFLLELAHYEWMDTALSISEEALDWSGVDVQGDLLDGVPVLSPLAWPLAYRFPVHRIGPDFLPQQPPEQPTCLVLYRDRHDRVGFLEVNPVTARLLALLMEAQNRTGRELLARIAAELKHPRVETVISGGLEILHGLRDRDIVLGTALRAVAGPD
jgi:uncharacterized protein